MASTISILVVDDNPINRQYFSMALNKSGFAVTLAENGFEAVELAKESKFDIILLDIRMPEMDGYEVSQRIKSLDYHRNTPIIATSAESILAENEGLFDDFLLKPISPKLLKSTVLKYCQVGVESSKPLVFNKTHAMKYAYDDEEIIKKLIALFSQDINTQLDAISEAIAQDNPLLIRDIIHKFRGSCKACGADELDSCLQELSQQVKSQDKYGINERFCAVKKAAECYLAIEKV